MLRILFLALALAAGLSSAAQAQNAKVVSTCGAQSLRVNDASNLFMDATGNLCTPAGGGGSGSTGSVTAAGTNGTVAQAVQGIANGVPQNSYTGQYNTTLPTFTNGQSGYVALDVNGRQILSPTVTLPISVVDGGDVTQGTKADTAATNGTSSWSVVALLKGIYNGLLAPTPAGTNIIGKVGIDQTTPGTTNAVQVTNQPTSTTTGALQPPTAASGKITQTQVSVAATTSTQLVAANTARIAVELQCDGTAPVGIDRTGAALTSPTAAPLVIPSGSYPLYTMPIATQTAITAYTATAQVCRVTEYNR